jgi:hypothetical protein
MNLKSLIAAVVTSASIVPAFAGPQFLDVSDAPSGKSRAEVLADLEAYQASGLADLERRIYVDWTSPQYEMARRIYASLLASDSFKQRVIAIAKERGEAPVSTAISDAPVQAR